MIRAAIVGASGYTGSETLRWLLGHPNVDVVEVMSTSKAGTPVTHVVPSLEGFTDLVLTEVGPTDADVVFLCVPHGAAAALVPLFAANQIIDLSADHRHAAGWTYGMAEWTELAGVQRIAVPGCFATALSLSIRPLVDCITGPVTIAAATGSTGSGASSKAATHHPERFTNLKAYKVLQHQHVPEVSTFLGGTRLVFVPWSAPVDRGIFATCFVPVGDANAAVHFADAYASAPLVRLRSGTPNLRHVRGTAFADIAVHQDADVAVVITAIDNLGKGAAGQAVQCLNLSREWPADLGLRVVPPTP